MNFNYRGFRKNVFQMLALLLISGGTYGHSKQLNLQDLSAFRDPGNSWKVAGDVQADINQQNEITIQNGTGILVNDPGRLEGENILSSQYS